MNQMELKTLEMIQYFLQQIAMSLEDIAKELKKQNVLIEPSQCDTEPNEPSSRLISNRDAYRMLKEAGIPVMYNNNNDDIVLQTGELLIGSFYGFLKVVQKFGHMIGTDFDDKIRIEDLTEAHIEKFITDYKTMEKEIEQNEVLECESRHISKIEAYELLRDAGIRVKMNNYGNSDIIIMENGELLIGESFAFLEVDSTANSIYNIGTSGDEFIPVEELTKAHIVKFISDYKALEKEISK